MLSDAATSSDFGLGQAALAPILKALKSFMTDDAAIRLRIRSADLVSSEKPFGLGHSLPLTGSAWPAKPRYTIW